MFEPMPHYDTCSLLLPMFGDNNGTVFPDLSPNPKAVSVFGNAKTVTAQSKYYGSSAYFDGSADYLMSPRALPVSGDFTMAAWINVNAITANQQAIISQKSGSGNNSGRLNFAVDVTSLNGVLLLFIGSASSLALRSSTSISANTWTHVAATRANNIFRIFINGILEATSTTFTQSLENENSYVGQYANGSYFAGYMQDVLTIDGAALWTSNFTPPTRFIETLQNGDRLISGGITPYSITLSLTESLAATDFTAVVTNANTGFIMSKTTASGATPTINLSTNDPCFVTLYPDYGTSWKASTVYALNDKAFPTDPVTTPYYYECTTAGTSGATEPTWPTSAGSTVTDGTVEWTLVERMVQPITHGPLVPS